MKNNASLAYSVLLIVGDFLALVAAFSVAYILRVKFDPRPLIEQIPAREYFWTAVTVLPLWILVHALIGLYNKNVIDKRYTEIGRLFVGSVLGILVLIGYDFVSNSELFPARLVSVYGFVLGFSFLVLFRTMAQMLRRLLFQYGVGISNVLIIGDTSATTDMVEAVYNTKTTGQRVLGTIGRRVSGAHHYKSFAAAVMSIKEPIHAIIQTELYKDQDRNNEILRYTRDNHASYRFVPGNTDMFVGNLTVDLFAGLPVIAVHQTALIGWGRIVKRLFDLAFSLVILVILSPILLVIILLQKLTHPGAPAFFKQTRLTRFNRKFTCYKFRSLKPKYNGHTPEEGFEIMGKPGLAKKFRDNGDFLANDPRLTKLGLFLRRTSIDELPQLVNVLRGDISLVGPRALVPSELNAYEKKHAILSVKSGMTGLAQISGRKNITFEERRRLDVYYVQNWSFWGDIVIMLKTVRAIINNN